MGEHRRSIVLHLADGQRRLPGPAGEHAVCVFKRGSLDVALSVPKAPVRQTPHTQDELYVVVAGRGVLLHDGRREEVAAGDLVFVAAGGEHQLVELTKDFVVWRVFFGPQGGEGTTDGSP